MSVESIADAGDELKTQLRDWLAEGEAGLRKAQVLLGNALTKGDEEAAVATLMAVKWLIIQDVPVRPKFFALLLVRDALESGKPGVLRAFTQRLQERLWLIARRAEEGGRRCLHAYHPSDDPHNLHWASAFHALLLECWARWALMFGDERGLVRKAERLRDLLPTEEKYYHTYRGPAPQSGRASRESEGEGAGGPAPPLRSALAVTPEEHESPATKTGSSAQISADEPQTEEVEEESPPAMSAALGPLGPPRLQPRDLSPIPEGSESTLEPSQNIRSLRGRPRPAEALPPSPVAKEPLAARSSTPPALRGQNDELRSQCEVLFTQLQRLQAAAVDDEITRVEENAARRRKQRLLAENRALEAALPRGRLLTRERADDR